MKNSFLTSALRHGILPVEQGTTPASEKLVTAANIEMFNYGFVLPKDALTGMSIDGLKKVLAAAREVAGADRAMVPTYPGFPKQVQELDTMTLLWEQILHYWSFGALMPDYPNDVRPGLSIEDAARSSKELRVMPMSEATKEIVTTMVMSPISMSGDDRTLVMSAFHEAPMTLDQTIEVFQKCKNFENAQVLVEAFDQTNGSVYRDSFAQFVNASTNVDELLRVILSLSSVAVDGHEDAAMDALHNLNNSAAYARQMVTLPRSDRRALVSRLGVLTKGFNADRMLGHAVMWQRVMRMVHPYSLKLTDESRRALDILHNNVEYKTLNSLIEEAMSNGDALTAVSLMEDNKRTGDLMRRAVALLRIVKDKKEASVLADSIAIHGHNVPMGTIISAYNGVIDANSEFQKITRVAGSNNTMRNGGAKIDENFQKMVLDALLTALRVKLSNGKLATAPVGVLNESPVPLVRRDLGTADRLMDRGVRIPVAGEGDTIRLFCHWENNQQRAGYVDIAAVVLDKDFKALETVTWNSWNHFNNRMWSTYSGDKLVYPGRSAAEYVDVDTKKVMEYHPTTRYVALTLQSWSGFPLNKMSVLCGAMLRNEPNSGEVFQPQTVEAAFQPTTPAMQSVPLVFDLKTGEMVWIDSSSGSTATQVSAVDDSAVGPVIRDEISRPRMTIGQLAELWAEMSGVETLQEPADRDTIVSLLG